MRILLCGLLVAALLTVAASSTDTRLMSDTEYKAFLNEVEAKLPTWEAALKRLDPAKSNISFTAGQSIVRSRDVGLLEINYVRETLDKLRGKRTVSAELALEGYLRGVSDALTSITEMEVAAGVTLSNLESFSARLNQLIAQLGNDLFARIELLEKGCP